MEYHERRDRELDDHLQIAEILQFSCNDLQNCCKKHPTYLRRRLSNSVSCLISITEALIVSLI